MAKQDPILSDITREQWRAAVDSAMAATDFDGMFHRLYQVMGLHWYKGPESARELIVQLFDHLMIAIFDHPPGIAIRDHVTWVESGCLRLELRVSHDSYQCIINFKPHTAEGSSFTRR